MNLALDIAPKLECGVVWVNSTNLFDASAGFGGKRESGFGREGGWEGLFEYTKPAFAEDERPEFSAPPAAAAPMEALPDGWSDRPGIDRTYKHYIGGRQVRPDSGLSLPCPPSFGRQTVQVGRGNRKDIRNAVEAARKAQPGWRSLSGHARAQILYYIAENLSSQSENLAELMLNDSVFEWEIARINIESAANLLFSYAAWADKFDGRIHGVPFRGLALAVNEPVGVSAAVLADGFQLNDFVALFAPLISMGNTCVLSVSGSGCVPALEFCKILHSSDVPAGVVNVVSGIEDELAPVLAAHDDVDSVWHFGSPGLARQIETLSAGNLKRTWIGSDYGMSQNLCADEHIREFLRRATDVKNIWVPYGE